jgi:hypothetical protein
MKECCRNCHFLATENRPISGDLYSFAWSEKERSEGKVREHLTPKCYMGVWDAGVNPGINDRLPDILDKKRNGDCFFIENKEGMLFDAAKELQRRRRDNEHLKRSLLYTRIGLWIAGGALFANVIVKVAGW